LQNNEFITLFIDHSIHVISLSDFFFHESKLLFFFFYTLLTFTQLLSIFEQLHHIPVFYLDVLKYLYWYNSLFRYHDNVYMRHSEKKEGGVRTRHLVQRDWRRDGRKRNREKRERNGTTKEGKRKSSRRNKKERTEERRTLWVGPKEERWIAVEEDWDGGKGGNLPASSVRAFLHPSCPSFGCFHGRHLVGSFTPGRRAARKWEREREREREREKEREKTRESKREKENDSEESGKENEDTEEKEESQ